MTQVKHYGPNGQLLRFENPEGFYPVNRYQSLLLATSAWIETLDYATALSKPLKELRAIELCCGGGPVAVSLKAGGVGYVRAGDIDPDILNVCQRNAELNSWQLDEVGIFDLLNAPIESSQFDLVVCNPPCGREDAPREHADPRLKTAINGGLGGVRFIEPLFEIARTRLIPGGRLIFVTTSTMNYEFILAALDRFFPGRWRLDATTPVAQPYARAESPLAEHVLKLADNKEVFVWRGDDGWVWRLSWVIVAENRVGLGEIDFNRELFLNPRYFDPHSTDYATRVRAFTSSGTDQPPISRANPQR